MLDDRLSLLLDSAPELFAGAGMIAVIGATAQARLAGLPKERVTIFQRLAPDYLAFEQRGYRVAAQLDQPCEIAIIALPRAKAAARDLIAQACALSAGPVIIDGQKTDGIEPMLKALAKRGTLRHVISKAHGKIAVFEPVDLTDWRAEPHCVDGFQTAPGAFSADGLDPGSAVLIEALPARLNGHVVDLGAGWGPLAKAALERGADSVDLVEADFLALEAARVNLPDPRARFYWADARSFTATEQAQHVLCNPPFHSSRKADPALGQAFLQTAARLLARNGTLWLVANRHLPYERGLENAFGTIEMLTQKAGYKVIRAQRPRAARKG